MAYPESQTPHNQFVDQRPRIVVFAESGLLAGDLTAWLSGRFAVERVTSIPGAGNAVEQGASALVLIGSDIQPLSGALAGLVQRCLAVGCGVLMLGGESQDLPPDWNGRVCLLPALPEPAALFETLTRLVLRAARGSA